MEEEEGTAAGLVVLNCTNFHLAASKEAAAAAQSGPASAGAIAGLPLLLLPPPHPLSPSLLPLDTAVTDPTVRPSAASVSCSLAGHWMGRADAEERERMEGRKERRKLGNGPEVTSERTTLVRPCLSIRLWHGTVGGAALHA